MGDDLEQDLDDRLELIDLATGLPASDEQAPDGVLGVRVRYRVFFDEVLADYDHAWEYVATSAPVPRLERVPSRTSCVLDRAARSSTTSRSRLTRKLDVHAKWVTVPAEAAAGSDHRHCGRDRTSAVLHGSDRDPPARPRAPPDHHGWLLPTCNSVAGGFHRPLTMGPRDQPGKKGSGTVRTSRLEAFSDGVLAIIITIMVLELKVPKGHHYSDLVHTTGVGLLTYLLSFVYVGIYWNNHHHMFQLVKQASGGVLWANLTLLFCLSLFPFTTAWMDESRFAQAPVIIYGLNLLTAATAYLALQMVIIRQQGPESPLRQAVGTDIKGKISPRVLPRWDPQRPGDRPERARRSCHCPSMLRRCGDHVDRPRPAHRPDGPPPRGSGLKFRSRPSHRDCFRVTASSLGLRRSYAQRPAALRQLRPDNCHRASRPDERGTLQNHRHYQPSYRSG